MKFRNAFRCVVVALTTFGMVVPPIAYAGNGTPQTAPSQAAAIQDVALNSTGQLTGQLLNTSGLPVIGSAVQLQQNGKLIATATTNRSGHFAMASVKAGLYQIHSEKSAGLYRVWTAEGAPPAAKARVLLVDDGRVVRGMQGGNIGKMLLVGGLIATAGVIGGVIGYNIREFDDAS